MENPWLAGSLIALPMAAIAFVVVRHNVRRTRARSAARELDDAARRDVLARIDAAGRACASPRVLLRPALAGERASSWLGGEPALASGVGRPKDAAGNAARFLAQVRLDGASVPHAWRGTSVALFHAEDALVALAVDATAVAPAAAHGLVPLHVPSPPAATEAEDWIAAYDAKHLLERVPGLREALARRVAAPEDALPYLLAPFLDTHELDTCHVALVGGEPELIQGEHGLACTRCAKPLGFLFQVGDVLELRGDAPVVYVYGCDADRELRATVDMH